MTHTGVNRFQRAAAFLLTLVMLLTGFAFPAMAADWQSLSITVTWTDGAGNPVSAMAAPVSWSTNQAYWVRVSPEAMSGMTLSVTDPSGQYTYTTPTGDVLTGVFDAGSSLEGVMPVTITALDGSGAAVATYNLYISTQADAPQEEKPEPATASVTIQYVSDDGVINESETRSFTEGGDNTVGARSYDSYDLISDGSVYVSVYSDGSASPNPVVFQYQKAYVPPKTADVQVIYQTADGQQLGGDIVTCTENEANEIYAPAIDGYVLADGESSVKTVTVYGDGTTEPGVVVFVYAAEYVPPKTADVQVIYQTADGQQLGGDVVTCTENEANEIYAPAIDGYVLAEGESSVKTVTVYGDGTTEPGVVVFVYAAEYIPPKTADVQVIYQTADGQQLGGDVVTCTENEANEIYAPAIDGYVLAEGESSVKTVTVYGDGTTEPGVVVFVYAAEYIPPKTADVQVIYQTADGQQLGGDVVTCTENEANEIYAPAIDGYVLAEGEASVKTVTVYGDGTTEPGVVVFVYAAEYVPPKTVDVQVILQTAEGYQLGSSTMTCTENEPNEVYAPRMDGYVLAEDEAAVKNVTVYGDGTAEPNPVVFVYVPETVEEPKPDPEPMSAWVTVSFVGEDGREVAPSIQKEYTADGEYMIAAAEGGVDTTYVELVSPGEVWVKVSGGVAEPGAVSFTYREIPVEPEVPEVPEQPEIPEEPEIPAEPEVPAEPVKAGLLVAFRTAQGADVASAQYYELTAGVYNVEAQPADLQPGYVLDSADVVTVEVFADGTATHTEVVFLYKQEQPEVPAEPEESVMPPDPIPATLTVYYRNEAGEDVATAQQGSMTVGVYNIQAQPSDLQEGYKLKGADMVTVEVYRDGTASQTEIIFVYEKEALKEPVSATINVYYRNQRGEDIAKMQKVTLPGNATTTVSPDTSLVPLAYKENSAAPVSVTVSFEGVATPAEVVFVFADEDPDVPVPQGEMINRFGSISKKQTAVRSEPDSSKKSTVVTRLATGTKVYLLREEMHNDAAWYRVYMDGQQYFIKGDCVNVLTRKESDRYMAAEYEEPLPNFTAEDIDGVQEPEPDPITVDVKVTYITEGGLVLDTQTTPATSQQPVTIVPASDKVEGYILTSAASVQVTVDPVTGAADPAEVVFRYREPEPEVKTAKVQVLYVTEDNQQLDAQEVTCASDKPTVITPSSGKTEGYALVSAGMVEVTVDAQTGAANPAEVRFTYRQLPPATITVEVPVLYVDAEGNVLDQGSATCTSAAVTTVLPTSAKVGGYNLTSASSVQVKVDAKTGLAEPAEVRFTYARPAQYEGYALTTQTVALRTEISTSDDSIIKPLPKDTLLYVYSQQYDAANQAWSTVSTLDEQPGLVLDGVLRHITREEAQYYINLWEEENSKNDPEPEPSATPPQVAGTAVTVGDGVLFRQTFDAAGAIIAVLPMDTEVEVLGQAYEKDGTAWHSVKYANTLGYIRADMLRFVTNTEAPEKTEPPTVNPDGLSAYGYVSASSVNFRTGPSTSSSRIRSLKRYAMCLVLGTEKVGDSTWYHVKYNDQEGYIAGNYFKHMTISEVNEFLTSDQYRQGVTNNTTANNNTDNTGSYVGGGIVSEEDKVVDQWTNPNNGLHVSYEPFDPFATVAPIVTESALPTATVSPTATATITMEALPTVNMKDPDEHQDSGSSAVGWIVALIILAVAGGGVYAYVLYSQNKRKAAQRAAQRRAQAAQQQRANAQQRAAQPGQANQPRTGTYTNQPGGPRPTGYQQPQPRKPYTPGQTPYQRPQGQAPVNGAAQNPYQRTTAAPVQTPYQRPAGEDSAPTYQQAQNPYARPAESQNTYSASYREDGQPAVPQRQGRRAYRSQQNANYSASYRDNNDEDSIS